MVYGRWRGRWQRAGAGGNIHVRVERVGLEHHGDLALGGRQVVDLASADGHPAGVDGLKSGDGAQQRGLAAARRPHQHDEGAVLDDEVDVRQHLDGPVGFFQLVDADFGHGTLTSQRPR